MTFKTQTCVTVNCDTCDRPLDYDDYTPHFATERDAAAAVDEFEWFAKDGQHFCDSHTPDCDCDDCDHTPPCGYGACPGCERHAHNAPTAADLARSGQLALTQETTS